MIVMFLSCKGELPSYCDGEAVDEVQGRRSEVLLVEKSGGFSGRSVRCSCQDGCISPET